MNIQIIKSIDYLINIKNEWDDLLQKSNNNKLYYSYQWFEISYNTFHPGDQLYVITLRDSLSALVGVAPLVIVSEAYRIARVKKICFSRNNQNPSNDFLCMKGHERECVAAVMDHLSSFSDWDMIDLRMMDSNEVTAILVLQYLEKRHMSFGTGINRISPYIEIDTEWNEFWKNRSTKFRKSMRNKINKARARGYAIEKKAYHECDDKALADMQRISGKSWKRAEGTDLVTQKENWLFYNKICAGFRSSGNISLYFFVVDGTPAAFEFHIEDQSVAYPIRADYDENFEQLSPGSILEYEIINRLFEQGIIKEYNSCGHTYNYLMNWTNKTRQYINIEIFNNTFAMKSMHAFEYHLLPRLREYAFYNLMKEFFHRLKGLF